MRMHDEAREELQSLPDMNRLIDAMLEQQNRLRDRLCGLRGHASVEPVSGSKGGDLSGGVAKLVDMSRKIDELVDAYADECERIEARIMALDDRRYRQLLRWRYLADLPLTEVAVRMHYDYGSVRNMHTAALAAYQQKFFAAEV